MAETKQIKTALVSVFHKDGLDDLLKKLNEEGVKFLSTGGTQQFIESLGIACQKVEDLTSYPSILGGRVKTLHPKVFGGILGRRENEGDREECNDVVIEFLDVVGQPSFQAVYRTNLFPDKAGRLGRQGVFYVEFLLISVHCQVSVRCMLVQNYNFFWKNKNIFGRNFANSKISITFAPAKRKMMAG